MQRLIDANLNRLKEGLRVVEDLTRYYLNLGEFEEIKNIRHTLKAIDSAYYDQNILSRNSEEDLGRKPFSHEEKRESVKSIFIANFKRAEESLRSLEEVFKIKDVHHSRICKELRYEIYTLEKKIISLMKKELNLSLYLVTDSRHNSMPLEKVVEEGILGGVTFVQLREKHLSDREIIIIAQGVKQVCLKHRVPLVIDDRPDLCLILDVDGVHLGQNDIPIIKARQILGPHKIIGKSTHSVQQAKAAVLEDIDYFAFGPLFKTPTKDYQPVGLEEIEAIHDISKESGIPVVFIGGITEETIGQIRQSKIKSIAVVREIMCDKNPKEAAGLLKEKLLS